MHPLVRKYFSLVKQGKHVIARVGEQSGVTASAQHEWRRRNNPSVTSLQACLNAIGYELVIQKRENHDR